MTTTRCAHCKYLRRRCPSDCIFAPYFPSNNPQRFYSVHKIFGASNVGKMLKEIPFHLRVDTVNSLQYEAQRRIEDPVYGCVGIITQLQEQIHNAQCELAKVQAEIVFNVQQSQHHHQNNSLQFEQLEAAPLDNNVMQEEPTFIEQSPLYPLFKAMD